MPDTRDADIFDRLGLQDLPAGQRLLFSRSVQNVSLPAGTTVFSPGAPCSGWIMVEEGSVRVCMTSDTGREILLYRVVPGESCVLTTSCLFGEEPYAATGVTDGNLLQGVRFGRNHITTHTVVMRSSTGTVRYIKAQHHQLEKFHLD